MPNFIKDGTTLPAAKTDRTPLRGTSDPTQYYAAADHNAFRSALLDTQSFLRGAFQLFKPDHTNPIDVTVGSGAPSGSAAKGSLYVDVSGPSLYQNQDGATTWAAVGSPSLSSQLSAAATAYTEFYTVGGDVGTHVAGASVFVDDPQTYSLSPNTAGIIVMDVPAVSANYAKVYVTDGTDGVVLGHGVFDITWRCATTLTMSGAANGTADFSVMMGATPASATHPGGDPGLQFVAGISLTGTHTWWACVAAGPTTSPNIDTGVSVVADGMHKFRIIYDSSIPSAKFYIDDVLKATITTGLPANLTVQRFTHIENPSSCAHMQWIADYVAMSYTFSTPR